MNRETVTGRRFKVVSIPLSPSERRRLWHENLMAAIRWTPPKTRTEDVEVPKDSPEYETAPLAETIVWLNIPDRS